MNRRRSSIAVLCAAWLLTGCLPGNGHDGPAEHAVAIAERFPEVADIDDLATGQRIAFERSDGTVTPNGFGSGSVYGQVYTPRDGYTLQDIHTELTERILNTPGWTLSDATIWCANPPTPGGYARVKIIEDSYVPGRPPNVGFTLQPNAGC